MECSHAPDQPGSTPPVAANLAFVRQRRIARFEFPFQPGLRSACSGKCRVVPGLRLNLSSPITMRMGVPVHDDRRLFEFLVLEGAQGGLSWITILKKRENYRKAFDGFRADKIARYGARDESGCLLTPASCATGSRSPPPLRTPKRSSGSNTRRRLTLTSRASSAANRNRIAGKAYRRCPPGR